jgi:preprotein translocase subunit SecY
LVLAVFQAYGVAVGLENVRGLVDQPGPLFRLSTVLTLTGGTVFLIWLCNQITLRGVGNGIAWILFLGIVMAIPGTLAALINLVRTGAMSERSAVVLLALAIAAVAFVVCAERARRPLEVQFAGRQIGERAFEPRLSQLSLKLNSAGVVPAAVMLWLLPVLLTLSALAAGEDAGWVETLADALVPGRPGFLIYLIGGILIVAFIYVAFMIDPDDAAERLKRYDGVLPGVAPGEPTATAIDQVLTRVTMMGAAYLALVFVVPVVLISTAGLPFYFGGASLLILVCLVLDIETQVRGHKNIEQGGLRA